MGIADWFGKSSDGLGQTAAGLANGYVQGQIARGQLDSIGKLANTILDAAGSQQAVEMVRKMAADAAQDVLDATVTDPGAAQKPAQHILQAYAEIHRVATRTLRWYEDRSRWHLRAPWQAAKLTNVEVAELTEQLRRIAGVLWIAAQQCDYAGGKLLQRHNPLRHVAGDESRPVPPQLELAECLINVSPQRYGSVNALKKDIRMHIAEIAMYLQGLAERGVQSIQGASFDYGTVYSPAAVWAEAAVLAAATVEGMASCAMLVRLTQRPVGHANDARNGQPPAPGAATPKPLSAGNAAPDSRQARLTLLNGESAKPVPPAQSGTAS